MEYPLNSSTSTPTMDAQRTAHLREIISKINLYVGSLIFFIGIIGNILNILILSQRSLRSNTCIRIFIGCSISGTITIVSGLIVRIMSIWDDGQVDNARLVCKLRAFILFTFRLITFWLIMLATIDRWLVSSINARLRRLSSNKNVLRSVFFIVILSITIHIQVLYCHESNLDETHPLKCFLKDKKCRLVNDLIFAIITILVPLIFILVFGRMTISNIRLSQARIEPITTVSIINRSSQTIVPHRRLKRKDKYLFTILLIQVILLACLTVPMAIQKLYSTLTMNDKKSKYQRAIENFVYQVALLMTFIASGVQFYINMLSGGRVFRKALINLLQLIIQKIKCR